MIVFGFILSLSLAQQTAPAPAAPAAPAPSVSEPANEDNRMVCRRERVVGSNRPQKVCLTRQQWQEQRDNSRQMMDRTSPGRGEELPSNRAG